MTQKITLPGQETMRARLLQVDDNSHLQERFYPKLLANAGQERKPEGVVLMIVLAISDYTKGMPPFMANIMTLRAEEFIDALIMDEKMAEQAKEIYRQTQK